MSDTRILIRQIGDTLLATKISDGVHLPMHHVCFEYSLITHKCFMYVAEEWEVNKHKIPVHLFVVSRDMFGIVWQGSEIVLEHKPGCLIGTGLSGSLIIPSVSEVCNIPFGIVRKEEENSHGYVVECFMDKSDTFDYFIIDDLISTGGTTISRIRSAMKSYHIRATLSGIIVWNQFEVPLVERYFDTWEVAIFILQVLVPQLTKKHIWTKKH